MTPVTVLEGTGPVVLGVPHTGTWTPEEMRETLNDAGKALRDTDWRIHRLYEDLLEGATMVRANFHRYVIDANRDPGGESLYPGQNTTGLVPLTDFDGRAIWRVGKEPNAAAIRQRVAKFHKPYHDALEEQLRRVRDRWGVAVLYDCHSIRSEIPFLFEGRLPVFNIGTYGGTTCAPNIEGEAWRICRKAGETALNGRFKGGWTTRRYGRPAAKVHAIQMELAQRAYLSAEEAPWTYNDAKAGEARETLGAVLRAIDAWACAESEKAEAG